MNACQHANYSHFFQANIVTTPIFTTRELVFDNTPKWLIHLSCVWYHIACPVYFFYVYAPLHYGIFIMFVVTVCYIPVSKALCAETRWVCFCGH